MIEGNGNLSKIEIAGNDEDSRESQEINQNLKYFSDDEDDIDQAIELPDLVIISD